ncbi:unnamed protein product [Ranitomeya imitator]|uniref:G-protein coupled receptors family 3 profile domain-containing protein n=1 Tax=Ranitomeya imitator TaxID=111125 RepID=A0ABN9LDQ3_9NEOB|nr:unnamed protein product [Ranitomeya imitator]
MQKKLVWAKEHKEWRLDQCKSVLWSDESNLRSLVPTTVSLCDAEKSPNLNPIEMDWGELDRRVKAKGPTSAKHLETPSRLLEDHFCRLPLEAHQENAKSVQSSHQRKDHTDCLKCPPDYWSNRNRDACIPKEVDYLSFGEPLGITFSAAAGFGICQTLLVIVVFIKYRNTPIVRANNLEISFLLLTSLTLSFIGTFTFIGEPSTCMCLLRQIVFGISFVLTISCILVKTLVVILAFTMSRPNQGVMKYFHPSHQRILVGFTTIIQLVICMGFLSSASSFTRKNREASTTKIIIECNRKSELAFLVSFGYIGLLAVICFILAFLARNLPGSFNEAKFITFSLLVFVVVWVSFIPGYFPSTAITLAGQMHFQKLIGLDLEKRNSGKLLSSEGVEEANLSLCISSMGVSQCMLPARVTVAGRELPITVFVDSGSANNLIDEEFAHTAGFTVDKLPHPIRVVTINATPLPQGEITEFVAEVKLHIGVLHSEQVTCRVLSNLPAQMVLGFPWLSMHNPVIDWKTQDIIQWSGFCQENCLATCVSAVTSSIPESLLDFADVFSEKGCSELPPHRPYDCTIRFKPGAKLPKARMFNISGPERQALKDYIAESLSKWHIKPLSSPVAAGFFFVKKKDGGLRPCLDLGS